MEFLGLIILAVFILLYVMKMKPGKNSNQISTTELRKLLGDPNIQFIDVRTQGEFKQNHIKGFKNIPLQTISRGSEKLSKEKDVIVICQSGMRSAQASKILTKSGFSSVINVKGGMNSWN
ncbi:rhodanese-like domain-containing protein [Rossellomorea aquimaris]|uniref:rhodanese-like domain-containing protein n=1 Tax=Rossellomorea aquimaris TaxID=189382 RepID=UPI0007D08BD0|nr:rhodanese-like domain-containing protein [Rossellomorea aquimaris]